MNGQRIHFRTFGVIYVMAAALILTILFRGAATHPGVVLSIITVLFALQLLHRVLTVTREAALLYSVVLILVVVFSIIILLIGVSRNDLWLSTWYGLCGVGMLAGNVLQRQGSDDF